MRVVSLNAWCGALLEPLAAWLPRCGADVLCLQEVTWTEGHDGRVTYVDADRTSRQRASLFDDVRRALPGHQAQFLTCDTGPVLCADGVPRRQHFGLATLVAPHLAAAAGSSTSSAAPTPAPPRTRNRCGTPVTCASATATPWPPSRCSPRPRCPTTVPSGASSGATVLDLG